MHKRSIRFFIYRQLFKRLILFAFIAQVFCGCVTDRDSVSDRKISIGLSGVGAVDSILLFTSKFWTFQLESYSFSVPFSSR